jgi:hypothetical protein
MLKLDEPVSFKIHEQKDPNKHQDILWIIQVDNTEENIKALICDPVSFVLSFSVKIPVTLDSFIVGQPVSLDFSYKDKHTDQITIFGMNRNNRIFVSCPDREMKGTFAKRNAWFQEQWGNTSFSPELTVIVTPDRVPILAHYDLNLLLKEEGGDYSPSGKEDTVVGVTAKFLHNPYFIAYCFNKVGKRKIINVNNSDEKIQKLSKKFRIGNSTQTSLSQFSFIYQTRPIDEDGNVIKILDSNLAKINQSFISNNSPVQSLETANGVTADCVMVKFWDGITGAWQNRWVPLPPPEQGG